MGPSGEPSELLFQGEWERPNAPRVETAEGCGRVTARSKGNCPLVLVEAAGIEPASEISMEIAMARHQDFFLGSERRGGVFGPFDVIRGLLMNDSNCASRP
jgi:hypothetical protein